MTSRYRFACFLVSAGCYTAWLLPLAVGSPAQGFHSAIGPVRPFAPPARPPRLFIARDPFEPAPPGRSDGSAARPVAAAAANAAPFDVADEGRSNAAPSNGIDVPDIGGDLASASGQGDPMRDVVLKATIVGARAVAYVQNGGMLDIVRVGDRLGPRRIVRIDLQGIVFDDASRLDLSGGFRAPAAPKTTEHAITIEDLRRELGRLRRRDGAAVRAVTPAAAPHAPTDFLTPSPEPYPTVAPLPSIDPRGRLPDANPTVDTRGPTPYPVPGIDR